MKACGFWLASGKKGQMTLGDSSIIWILVLSLESEGKNPSVVSDSLRPNTLYDPWNSAGKNTGVGSLSLLQGIFQTQGSNPGLCMQADSLPAEPQKRPKNIGLGSLTLLQRIRSPDPGIKQGSPAMQDDSSPAEVSGKPNIS